MRKYRSIESVGEIALREVPQSSLPQKIAYDILIALAFLGLGVTLQFSHEDTTTIFVGAAGGLAAFFCLREWKPFHALTSFIAMFSLGAVVTFLSGSDRAAVAFGVLGIIAAFIHHYGTNLLDIAERETNIDINRDGQIGLPELAPSLDDRRQVALRYVFSYSGRNGDTFKRRIARDNLTLMGYLSQREWREWVTDLERAGVVRCPNAQVTEPMVTGYETARTMYERWKAPVVLTPDPAVPQKLVRQ